jgi:hypothetical protein
MVGPGRDMADFRDMTPALKLARKLVLDPANIGIASAFICFIQHYEVVPELAKEFAAAANLARTAVRCLLEAKSFEDVIGKGTNLNRALWAVHGGQWKGPERGGLELEPVPEPVDIDEESGSDGGWKVERSRFWHDPADPSARPQTRRARDASRYVSPVTRLMFSPSYP